MARSRKGTLNRQLSLGWRSGWTALYERLRSTSGQAMVEFAMVAVPLFLIILGGIDFGSIFKDVIAMRSAVSSAARQASVGFAPLPPATFNCQLTGPAPPTAADKNLMCFVHSQDGIPDTKARVMILVGDANNGGAYATGHPITVCEEYSVQSLTGALPYIDGHIVTTQSTNPVSTKDTGSDGGFATASETALPGKPWSSFCTLPQAVS
jgi:hypothetical protein